MAEQEKTTARKVLIRIIELIIALFLVVIIVGIINQYVIATRLVRGDSMLPTIKNDGESVAYLLRTYKNLDYDDIIVFYRPDGNVEEDPSNNPAQKTVTITEFFTNIASITKKKEVSDSNAIEGYTCVIKRVIGLPGDQVYVNNGDIYRKKSGSDQWGKLEDFPSDSYAVKDSDIITVGEGELYVLGDNRNNSYDSEDYGCIKRSWVYGKVILLYTDGSYKKV